MSVDTNTSIISPMDVGDISRWEVAQQHAAEQQAVADADAYILELVRIFARAVQAMARFQCEDVIEQLDLLPLEQQYSPTVMTLLGRAFFEMLDYVKVITTFYASVNTADKNSRLNDVLRRLASTILIDTKIWICTLRSFGICLAPPSSRSYHKSYLP